MICVPLLVRFIFCDRRRSMCDSPALLKRTFPLAVKRKRFLALDLFFNLGISISSSVFHASARISFGERQGIPRATAALLSARLITLGTPRCKAAHSVWKEIKLCRNFLKRLEFMPTEHILFVNKQELTAQIRAYLEIDAFSSPA